MLCGSDVVLGLDRRSSPASATCGTPSCSRPCISNRATRGTIGARRATSLPATGATRRCSRAGDPYFSPNLSAAQSHTGELAPARRASAAREGRRGAQPLLRGLPPNLRKGSEAAWLADVCRADDQIAQRVAVTLTWPRRPRSRPRPSTGSCPTSTAPSTEVSTPRCVWPTTWPGRTVCRTSSSSWLHPTRSSSARRSPPRSRLWPTRPDRLHRRADRPALDDAPAADVSIATLWVTAYSVARFSHTRRKFYLIQDFEPMFYPAGTQYALAEEGYRLGLYGLCNTDNLLDIYRARLRRQGLRVHPCGRPHRVPPRRQTAARSRRPRRVFVYAVSRALAELLGDRRRRRWPRSKSSWATGCASSRRARGPIPTTSVAASQHLGLLDYRETGELYRSCDAGVALTVSAHPSYLPLELMACGVPVVAFDNPAGDWILHHDENALRCRRTVDGLADAITRLRTRRRAPRASRGLPPKPPSPIGSRSGRSPSPGCTTSSATPVAEPGVGPVMRYPPVYDEQGSTGRAVALLRDASPGPRRRARPRVRDGGRGAEPLRSLGLDYVGCDVDVEALAHLADRGFETHDLSLVQAEDELVERIRESSETDPWRRCWPSTCSSTWSPPRWCSGRGSSPAARATGGSRRRWSSASRTWRTSTWPPSCSWDGGTSTKAGSSMTPTSGSSPSPNTLLAQAVAGPRLRPTTVARRCPTSAGRSTPPRCGPAHRCESCSVTSAPRRRSGGHGPTSSSASSVRRPRARGRLRTTLAADEELPLITAVVVGEAVDATPLLADLAVQQPAGAGGRRDPAVGHLGLGAPRSNEATTGVGVEALDELSRTSDQSHAVDCRARFSSNAPDAPTASRNSTTPSQMSAMPVPVMAEHWTARAAHAFHLGRMRCRALVYSAAVRPAAAARSPSALLTTTSRRAP